MAISLSWERATSRLRSLFVGLSIIALLATGCGGGSGGEAASGSTDTTTASGEDGDATTAGDQADAESGDSGDGSYADAESPLAAYLGYDMTEEGAKEQERVLEQKVQECMRSQGFEYEMRDSSDMVIFGDSDDMSPTEYAAEHGYGMADSYLDMPGAEEESEWVDPNQAMLEAMGETEQQAWQTALYGPPIDEADLEEGTEGADVVMGPQGCYGDASAEVYGDFTVFQELGPAFEAMDAAIQADPRVVEMNTKWSECMSDAGYEFASTNDAWMYISDKVDKLTSNGIMMGFPEESAESDDPLVEGESIPEDFPDDIPTLDELRPQLEEIRTEEIALATADASCQGDDIEKLQEISREYELQFIEDNKAVLDKANS